ncbi:MAG: hypothetical protein K8M05_27510 [Deltaproteobacteria bacterium]|nr:hypothetical protein [Kofleriaceae bacterium]
MSPEPVAEMKRHLAAAKAQSSTQVEAASLPARAEVEALVGANPDARWTALSDEERFFLFELSPDARTAASSDEVARAYCAGLTAVVADWWGLPGQATSGLQARFVAAGRAVAPCLRPLVSATAALRYKDGESNSLAHDHAWVLGDLAAGLAAAVIAESFDPSLPADARAARRGEIAAALTAME